MSKRRMTFTEPVVYVNPSSCCYGYGYLVLLDLDEQPYDKVACRCAAGKKWAAGVGA
ncbi:hypothetical protein N5079_16830 [Planotetraspora sp. A-T 1434]|uniref:hypothetical protein n=1 Tax=Planotetraspora sp. A-T 1434 TaxID=2979219 RepID=UPI0021BDFFA3|nr:hypothetical protein [Planotetraspora sp. A-T 1434]MCT9931875.1 hypothetical protein [Planotetraspora sp. A-T 1434]